MNQSDLDIICQEILSLHTYDEVVQHVPDDVLARYDALDRYMLNRKEAIKELVQNPFISREEAETLCDEYEKELAIHNERDDGAIPNM